MYALFPLCFFHRVFLYFLHLFSCFQTDSRSSLKASKNDRFETLKADSFFRVLQTNPPHFQKFNQSTYIYIYLNFNTLGIIPRSGFSTLSQYDSYILQNTIWMNTTKIADRCQKWLFGKCIAFQTCYVGWVVQSCTSFRAKQNAEKTWKKREVPCFSGTAPGSAEVIGKPYNISVSQTALRKEPCEFRSSIKDTWRIIPVTLRSK